MDSDKPRNTDPEEPSVIINDRRIRFDEDNPPNVSSPSDESRAEAAKEEEERSLREKTEEAREGRLLALLAGMVASHLFVDPSTGFPDERFNPEEARFYLDLVSLYAESRGKKGLISRIPEEAGIGEKEPPRLGHIPAILGAMAVHALGVDPATGRPGAPANLDAARLYIDLLDFLSTTVGEAMTEEDRSYMQDILYQTKMFFVRQKDLARPGGPAR